MPEVNRKIVIAEGLLWEGRAGNKRNILGTFEADKIAEALGFMYVERLIDHYGENITLLLDDNLKVMEIIKN